MSKRYEALATVLLDALDQAKTGKGHERHAQGDTPFERQPICEIARMVGTGYLTGQAMKKAQEAMRLPNDRAQAELLGAINYLAAAVLILREQNAAEEPTGKRRHMADKGEPYRASPAMRGISCLGEEIEGEPHRRMPQMVAQAHEIQQDRLASQSPHHGFPDIDPSDAEMLAQAGPAGPVKFCRHDGWTAERNRDAKGDRG